MIRPFRPADRAALVAITQRAFDGVSIDQNIERLYGTLNGVTWQERKGGHVEADIAADPNGILVWEEDGEVVGYVSCRYHPRTLIGSVANLAVRPDRQGGGIGRRLLEAAIEHLRGLGMAYVRIETLEQNDRCRALYPRLGFREVARQIHYIRPLADGAP